MFFFRKDFAMKFFVVLFFLFSFTTLQGCCIPQYVEYNTIPAWVNKPPSDPKFIYAVGSSTMGLSWDDSKQRARENAIENLSQILSFQIYSKMTEIKTRELQIKGGFQNIVSKSKLQAQEESLWMDKEGISGQKQVFVLMKMPIQESGE
jgi:hypothetical protein